MMKRILMVFTAAILAVSIWGFSTAPTNTTAQDEQILISIMSKVLKDMHFNKIKIDDEMSEKWFDLYIKRLDYNKMYFMEGDIKKLSAHRHSLDDALMAVDLTHYKEIKELMDKRLEESEVIFESVLEQPFDFTKDEVYEVDVDKRTYPKSKAEQKEAWRRYLKFSTLNSYLNRIEKQEKALAKGADSVGSDFEVKTMVQIEEEARKQVLKNMKQRLERRMEVDDEDNFAIYLNALANVYGPHTQYFPPQEKENFDMRMTGRLEGIGAVLQEADGYIKINSIVTGSACWRQGDLEVGDLIIKVAQGEEEPVDIVDAPMKEVLKLIRGPKGTEVRLTVQKDDGEIMIIPIVRDVVVREETYAKSAVITDEVTGKKFGYLFLPSFYSKFGQQQGRKSSEDVEMELEKLMENGVEGIVFDLRSNGGGSLPDAVEMAGLFIKEGPIVQVKATGRPARSKTDYNSNVTYDGPLVVMINGYSASASEIVSGALKDYNRAVIVGSPTTYGKGTVQTFMDLNQYVNPSVSLSNPFGSLKFTVQQFYRVNGSSTQFKGVPSDIILPDMYDFSESNESSLDHALPWDSVQKVSYTPWNGDPINMEYLRSSSAQRVAGNNAFRAIVERMEWVSHENETTTASLNYDKALAKREERKAVNKKVDDIDLVDPTLKIRSLQEVKIADDTIAQTRIEKWEEQISEDLYLQEGLNILNDMVVGQVKPSVAGEDPMK